MTEKVSAEQAREAADVLSDRINNVPTTGVGEAMRCLRAFIAQAEAAQPQPLEADVEAALAGETGGVYLGAAEPARVGEPGGAAGRQRGDGSDHGYAGDEYSAGSAAGGGG